MNRNKEGLLILSFTGRGTSLNSTIGEIFRQWDMECECYAVARYCGEGIKPLPEDRKGFIGANWGKQAIIFIGAAGIAVRYIAPWVRDKYTDPAVLVLDEAGRYVIPLLSGHIGGAAELAERLGKALGAAVVQTTATDVRGKFAVDVFAKKNGLLITDREKVKTISAAVLRGEKVCLITKAASCRIEGNLPEEISLCRTKAEADENGAKYRILIADTDREAKEADGENETVTLVLRPVNITVGVGCRKGIPEDLLEKGLERILKEAGILPGQVEVLASIDLKKAEPALLALSEKCGIPFVTCSAEELSRTGEVTSHSEFVKKVTGVDNVCERAALFCCEKGTLVKGKTVGESMTAALVRRPFTLRFANEEPELNL